MAIGEILEPTGWLGEADKIDAPADQFPTSGLEKIGGGPERTTRICYPGGIATNSQSLKDLANATSYLWILCRSRTFFGADRRDSVKRSRSKKHYILGVTLLSPGPFPGYTLVAISEC